MAPFYNNITSDGLNEDTIKIHTIIRMESVYSICQRIVSHLHSLSIIVNNISSLVTCVCINQIKHVLIQSLSRKVCLYFVIIGTIILNQYWICMPPDIM